MSQKVVRAAVGVAVLLVLALVVGGWWSDYRRAADQRRVAPRHEDRATESTAAPSTGEGEGSTPSAGQAEEKESASVVVLIDGLNFRPEPDEDAEPIRGLDKGERLDLVGTKKGWYEVRDEDGEQGWVSSNPSYTKTERR